MGAVKIQLSAEESRLVTDPGVILTKNRIVGKVAELLGALSEQQVELMEERRVDLPPELFRYTPKISRGEQYQGLPWLVLDYPRVLAGADWLAVRQLFWWGHEFSSALLVSGRYREKLWQRAGEWAKEPGMYICVHASPWEHDFLPGNYELVSSRSLEDWSSLLADRTFLKLAKRIGLADMESAPPFLLNCFGKWVALISCPGGETNP